MKKELTDLEIEELIQKENLTLAKFEEMKKDPIFGKRILGYMSEENVKKIERALKERESKVK